MLAGIWGKYGKAFCSFGAIQAMQLAMPLLALPWLARKLGPEAFGLLMYLCLIPPLVALLMDWGLALGGGRAAALSRGDPKKLAELLGAVLAAKFLLASLCILLCLLAFPFLPYIASYPGAFWLAVAAGMSRGMSPLWFFQGAGLNLGLLARLDVGASLAVLLLVLACVKQPWQWPWYLFFLAVCRGAAYFWLLAGLCAKFRPKIKLAAGFEELKKTAVLFGSAFSLMVCYNGSQLCLGYFLSSGEMGILAASSKMLRSLGSLINPFTQTLFPYLCIAAKDQKNRFGWPLIIALASGCAVATLLWPVSPLLIRLALGGSYQNFAWVFSYMLLALPFMAGNNVLAYQTLVPAGHELGQLWTQAVCACLIMPGAALAAACWGLAAAAFLPLCLEIGIFAGLFACILHYGLWTGLSTGRGDPVNNCRCQ